MVIFFSFFYTRINQAYMDISSIRKDYKLKTLDEKEVASNPFEQFGIWFKEAVQAEVLEVNAMVLSTVSDAGKPSGRVVLLKDFDKKGFVFYTNYGSRKGGELLGNPHANLTFFWPQLERQVRLEGIVEKVSVQESEEYFQSRPFESRVGAWVSAQSAVIESRAELEVKFVELLKEFEAKGSVPKPEYWGGYRLVPTQVEFWQGRPSRLHDRVLYEWVGSEWTKVRLAP
jgi:pyridoxamine 5'-phosphate oxidase